MKKQLLSALFVLSGDVVEILSDGVTGGRKAEVSDNFLIIEMDGVSVARAQYMLDSNQLARRLRRLSLSTISAPLTLRQQRAIADGTTTKLTEAQVDEGLQTRKTRVRQRR